MRRVIVTIVAGVLSLALALPASAESANHLLFPPDAVARGKTLAEWQAAYQIWANEIPTPENPRTDPRSAL
jgi:hypothetical protein